MSRVFFTCASRPAARPSSKPRCRLLTRPTPPFCDRAADVRFAVRATNVHRGVRRPRANRRVNRTRPTHSYIVAYDGRGRGDPRAFRRRCVLFVFIYFFSYSCQTWRATSRVTRYSLFRSRGRRHYLFRRRGHLLWGRPAFFLEIPNRPPEYHSVLSTRMLPSDALLITTSSPAISTCSLFLSADRFYLPTSTVCCRCLHAVVRYCVVCKYYMGYRHSD